MKRAVCLLLFGCLLSFAATAALGQVPPPPQDDGNTIPQPRMFVAERIRGLGAVTEGDKPEVAWVIENQGNGDLVIDEVKAGCGCTVVELPNDDRIIPPSGMVELVAVFDSNKRRGAQRKNVTVISNDPAEPSMKLEFTADVEGVYDAKPVGAVNLRMVQRGQVGSRPLELTPAAGRSGLEVLDVTMSETDMVTATVSDRKDGRPGKLIAFTVLEGASLGRVNTVANIKVNVDGIERDLQVPVRGEVVADIVWQPKVIDATRMRLARGRKLTPLTVSAAVDDAFEILSASAGPGFDVSYEPITTPGKGSRYRVELTVNDQAPAGPLATSLLLETTSLDQPELRIPVYANIAPILLVEPSKVVLRKTGQPSGTRRRVKLQAATDVDLKLLGFQNPNENLRIVLDQESLQRYRHLRYLEFFLDGQLNQGVYEFDVTVATEVPGAEIVVIPVRIEIP